MDSSKCKGNKGSCSWRWQPINLASITLLQCVTQVYSGGTFKKSMNYYSFREAEKRRDREVVNLSNCITINIMMTSSLW